MKKMKILSMLIAVLTAVTVCSISVFAKGSAVKARDISSSAVTIASYSGYKVTCPKKSVSVKRAPLSIKKDEMLVILKGVSVYLGKGADISGAVYIAEGGKLILSDGSTTLGKGSKILSDGTVKV